MPKVKSLAQLSYQTVKKQVPSQQLQIIKTNYPPLKDAMQNVQTRKKQVAGALLNKNIHRFLLYKNQTPFYNKAKKDRIEKLLVPVDPRDRFILRREVNYGKYISTEFSDYIEEHPHTRRLEFFMNEYSAIMQNKLYVVFIYKKLLCINIYPIPPGLSIEASQEYVLEHNTPVMEVVTYGRL